MPLQNRVAPNGKIEAVPARGLVMGNRGGRIHDPLTRTLTRRRWASRRWICCQLAFKGRRRKIMGESYTELFFLDEVTALASGHRPCFECRRRDAKSFAGLWAQAEGMRLPPLADDMDRLLHSQRLQKKSQNDAILFSQVGNLPDGTMIASGGDKVGEAFAVRNGQLLHWSYLGYTPLKSNRSDWPLQVLTPAIIVDILRAGYAPLWHSSASGVEA